MTLVTSEIVRFLVNFIDLLFMFYLIGGPRTHLGAVETSRKRENEDLLAQ